MGKIEEISVALTSELAEIVRGAVEDGRHASVCEVIRQAVRDWTARQKRLFGTAAVA